MEAALASAERQIERLRHRESMHARVAVEARHQLVEASSASSVISEDGPFTPEAGMPQALMTHSRPRLAVFTCMTGCLLSCRIVLASSCV